MTPSPDSATAPPETSTPTAVMPRQPGRSGVVRHILRGLGGFLLALALLVPWLVYPLLAKLPADPQQEQALAGVAKSVLFPDAKADGGARQLHNVQVRIATYTAEASDSPSDSDHVVWDLATRTEAVGVGLVNARIERISLDPHTTEPVNCCGDRLVTDISDARGESLTHEGYLNFPFDTQKKDYQLWDIQLRKTRTAVYSGEETRDGVTVYKFVSNVPMQSIGTMDLPGALFGLKDPSVKADSQYSSVRTFWIEPNTAAVVDMHEDVKQQFVYQGHTLVAMDASLDQQQPGKSYRDGYHLGSWALPWLRGRISIVLAVLGLALIAITLPIFRRRSLV